MQLSQAPRGSSLQSRVDEFLDHSWESEFLDPSRACTGFGKLSKITEIGIAIFQELESFGSREVYQIGFGKVLDFCFGKSKISGNGYNLVYC